MPCAVSQNLSYGKSLAAFNLPIVVVPKRCEFLLKIVIQELIADFCGYEAHKRNHSHHGRKGRLDQEPQNMPQID
jgi:hypothetical protein